jgi:glucose dehydrogenase
VIVGRAPAEDETFAAGRFSGCLIAHDKIDGSVRWHRYRRRKPARRWHLVCGFEFGASPLVFDLESQGQTRTLMAAGTRTGTVHVFDANSGEYIWLNELGRGSDNGDTGTLANTKASSSSTKCHSHD